jgi:hypothetical protein
MSYYLLDSTDVSWLLTVDDNGLLITTVQPSSSAVAQIYLEDQQSAQGWALTVNTDGTLLLTASTGQSYLSGIVLVSPTGIRFLLQATGGLLETSVAPPPGAPVICGPPYSYAPWYIKNANGAVFKMTADVYGRIVLVPSPSGSPALPFVFLTDTVTGQLWQLNLLNSGQITITASDADVTGNVYIPIGDPNQNSWWIRVNNSVLQTTEIVQCPPPIYPPSSCPAPWFLEDAAENVWQIGADARGRITLTASPGSTPALPFIFLEDQVTRRLWQLVALASGQLQATVSSAKVRGSKQVPIEDVNGQTWIIVINNSNLQTIRVQERTDIQVPEQGVIYNPPDYLPPYTQPNGPNTETFPSMATGELIALFALGCSHFVNNLYVTSGTANCQTACLILCPRCSFLQRIIVPYSAVFDSNNEAYAYLFP